MGAKILGFAEIQRNLDKYEKVLSKTQTEALIEIGEKVVLSIKKNTPVDSGRLRGSMTYTIDKKQSNVEGSAKSSDKIDKSDKKDTVTIGTNVVYAEKVEYFAKGASKGYFLRGFNQAKTLINPILKKHFGKVLK